MMLLQLYDYHDLQCSCLPVKVWPDGGIAFDEDTLPGNLVLEGREALIDWDTFVFAVELDWIVPSRALTGFGLMFSAILKSAAAPKPANGFRQRQSSRVAVQLGDSEVD